jgi:PcfJ-like protein
MKILELSRNIVNGDAVESWLDQTFNTRFPGLATWTNSVVRKWIIKTAPAVKDTSITDSPGMPAWLRDSMSRGVTPESVVLDQALETRVQNVLDFMNDLVTQRPETNIAAIGFEVAEKKSEKWHERLTQRVAQQTPATVVDEAGTTVAISYPDGWSWRHLSSEAAMDREGSAMGHCVGTHGYYQATLRGGMSIYSLRDAKNEPHVTIEVDEKAKAVKQIRGKSNKAVILQYQPRVADYLKSRTWTSVNFDGSDSIVTEVTEYQALRAPAYYTHNGYRVVTNISATYTYLTQISIRDPNGVIAGTGSILNHPMPSLSIGLSDANTTSVLRHMCYDKKLNLSTLPDLEHLLDGTTWTNRGMRWCSPVNAEAKDFVRAFARANVQGQVYLLPNNALGAVFLDVKGGELYLLQNKTVGAHVEMLNIGKLLGRPISSVFKTQDLQNNLWYTDPELVRELEKDLMGKSVVTDASDTELLDTLLTALKQPDVSSVKAAYLKLKTKPSIGDQDFKSLGFTTSGRAINAISLVLTCSLALKQSHMFRSYVFSKPNTLNCWLEVMVAPKHLTQSLLTYGLDVNQLEKIMEVLRNEFLRLVPTQSELDELDLDAGLNQRVLLAMRYAKAHRQNTQRSKAIWALL